MKTRCGITRGVRRWPAPALALLIAVLLALEVCGAVVLHNRAVAEEKMTARFRELVAENIVADGKNDRLRDQIIKQDQIIIRALQARIDALEREVAGEK